MNGHEEAVRAAARRYRRADAALEQARLGLIAALTAALRDGEPPTDVAEWSTLTPTYVRKQARAAGIAAPVVKRAPRRRGHRPSSNPEA